MINIDNFVVESRCTDGKSRPQPFMAQVLLIAQLDVLIFFSVNKNV